jgi:hypothetical protein
MEILDDDELLESERSSAAGMRDRYKGTSNTGGGYGSYGSSNKNSYGSGYDNDDKESYSNSNSNKNYSSYGTDSKFNAPSSLNQTSSTFTKPKPGGLYDDYSNKSSNLRAKLGIQTKNDPQHDKNEDDDDKPAPKTTQPAFTKRKTH